MMDRNLDGFPSYYHKNRAQHPRLLKVIEAVYQQALPFKLDGPDLATFLTILYQAVCYFKPKLVVQTGTFIGTSSVALALGFRRNGFGQLQTIDPEPPEYFGQANPVSLARKVTAL